MGLMDMNAYVLSSATVFFRLSRYKIILDIAQRGCLKC
jgi:hypothetical protein